MRYQSERLQRTPIFGFVLISNPFPPPHYKSASLSGEYGMTYSQRFSGSQIGDNSSQRATIVTVATIKGGSGKSTIVAGLSTHWGVESNRIALIDADPNGTLTRWCEKGRALSRMTLRSNVDEYSMISEINELSSAHDYVIIDCAGFANQAMIFALGASDVVLIPVMADEANIYEAIRTKRLAENAVALSGREPKVYAILNRVKRTLVTEHTKEQLGKLGIELLSSSLADRAVFQEASFHGSSPVEIAPSCAAATELRNLAQEVETLIRSDRQHTNIGHSDL